MRKGALADEVFQMAYRPSGGSGYPPSRRGWLSQLVSQVLAARGISTPEQAAAFLERGRDLTCSPLPDEGHGPGGGVHVQPGHQSGSPHGAVFGDYDVDGITATVILVDYLKSRGADVVHYIPRRIEDGYGLSRDAIKGLFDQGVRLLVTVDCGITGVEEVDYANSLGLDVVITDHHECKDTLPRAVAVVDPHRADCPYPFKHLAGCGVALKLVLALGGPDREEASLCPVLHAGGHRHHSGRHADVRRRTAPSSPGLATWPQSGLHRPPRPAAGGRPHG